MVKRHLPQAHDHAQLSIAADLAAASLSCDAKQRAAIDRRLAPPDGPPSVSLPVCPPAGCRSRRLAALLPVEADFTDLIDPTCWAALPACDRSHLAGQVLPIARLAIDQVSGGAAQMVEPGYEDVARVPSPYQRAEVMLALGWLTASCSCMRALIASLPDDSVQGLYVRAGIASPTSAQRVEKECMTQRAKERSEAWSVHLKRKAAFRRQFDPGDLFAAFSTSPGQGASPTQPL